MEKTTMTEQEFKEVIHRAKNGDFNALEEILKLYEPMINKHSYILGKMDEDLRQYILLRVVTDIKRFKL